MCDSWDMVETAARVAEMSGMRVRVKKNHHMGRNFATVVPAATLAGGILDGPEGFVLGGLLGGVGAMAMSHKGHYESAGILIRHHLAHYQREELAQHVRNIILSRGVNTAWVRPQDLILSDPSLRYTIQQTLEWFFHHQIGLKVKY